MADEIKACRMCANAFTDPELNSDNDLSYIGIGKCEKGHRMLLRSGDGRPVEVLVERWSDVTGWQTIVRYQPKYCPNCGRELKENAILQSKPPLKWGFAQALEGPITGSTPKGVSKV